jgi:hypothetical protein
MRKGLLSLLVTLSGFGVFGAAFAHASYAPVNQPGPALSPRAAQLKA